MKVLMFVIIFLMIGALFIVSEKGLDLNKETAQKTFVKYYVSWIGQTFDNLKSMSGYIIKLDWLPDKASTED